MGPHSIIAFPATILFSALLHEKPFHRIASGESVEAPEQAWRRDARSFHLQLVNALAFAALLATKNSRLSSTTQVASLAAKSHKASFARGLSFRT